MSCHIYMKLFVYNVSTVHFFYTQFFFSILFPDVDIIPLNMVTISNWHKSNKNKERKNIRASYFRRIKLKITKFMFRFIIIHYLCRTYPSTISLLYRMLQFNLIYTTHHQYNATLSIKNVISLHWMETVY